MLINPSRSRRSRQDGEHWFYRYLKGRTDYGALPRQSPPYWSRYAFVDVDRDSPPSSLRGHPRCAPDVLRLPPQVIDDLHEGIPLLQTWNGTGPYNPNLDPIVLSSFLDISLHEVTTLTALGMPGVWTCRGTSAGFGHH